MRLLLDENAPEQWLSLLHAQNHDAIHVNQRGWQGIEDTLIFQHALNENRILLTRNGFKRGPARLASLEAMLHGLHIIYVTVEGLEQLLQAIELRIDSVGAAFTQNPSLRRITIMKNLQLREESEDDIRRKLNPGG